MLMDYSGEIIYENSVDHQLFGLTKLDITVSSTNTYQLVVQLKLRTFLYLQITWMVI